MRRSSVIALVVAILVLSAAAFAITRNDPPTPPPASSNANQNTNSDDRATAGDTTEDESATTFTYADDGFSPATMTVKAGTVITVKNEASDSLQFASDPHPQHTDNSELNAGFVAKGQTKTFTAEKVGTWGIHNHLNEDHIATLIVEE